MYTGYQDNKRKEASLPSELKTVMKSIPYNEFIKGTILLKSRNRAISGWKRFLTKIWKSDQESSQSWILQVHGEAMCKSLETCFNTIWLLLEFSTENHESYWWNGSIWIQFTVSHSLRREGLNYFYHSESCRLLLTTIKLMHLLDIISFLKGWPYFMRRLTKKH